MQDGSERSIKNGGHRGAENRDTSQEDLYTRAKLEATRCRRSSLEESPSTPPPPPPPSSGAPIWERRPRVKTQLQFSFYIQTKLKTEKIRTHFVFREKTFFVLSAAKNCLFFRSWSWRYLRFPSPPRPPPSAPFSHDPVPHPFTGEQIFLTCIKICSSDISAHRQNKRLLFGTDLPDQCSLPPTLLTRAIAAGESKANVNAIDNGGEKLRLLPCPLLYSIYRYIDEKLRPLPCPLLVSLLAVCLTLAVTASVLFWNYTETRYLAVPQNRGSYWEGKNIFVFGFFFCQILHLCSLPKKGPHIFYPPIRHRRLTKKPSLILDHWGKKVPTSASGLSANHSQS